MKVNYVTVGCSKIAYQVRRVPQSRSKVAVEEEDHTSIEFGGVGEIHVVDVYILGSYQQVEVFIQLMCSDERVGENNGPSPLVYSLTLYIL